MTSVEKCRSTRPLARAASSMISSISSWEVMIGSAGLIAGPGPSKPFESIRPYSVPVTVSVKRIGLFHPGGVSMLRNRMYVPCPQPRAISIVRVLKLRVLGCHDVVVCFSNTTERTPWRASSSAAPRPTGPAPTINTGAVSDIVILLETLQRLTRHVYH